MYSKQIIYGQILATNMTTLAGCIQRWRKKRSQFSQVFRGHWKAAIQRTVVLCGDTESESLAMSLSTISFPFSRVCFVLFLFFELVFPCLM